MSDTENPFVVEAKRRHQAMLVAMAADQQKVIDAARERGWINLGEAAKVLFDDAGKWAGVLTQAAHFGVELDELFPDARDRMGLKRWQSDGLFPGTMEALRTKYVAAKEERRREQERINREEDARADAREAKRRKELEARREQQDTVLRNWQDAEAVYQKAREELDDYAGAFQADLDDYRRSRRAERKRIVQKFDGEKADLFEQYRGKPGGDAAFIGHGRRFNAALSEHDEETEDTVDAMEESAERDYPARAAEVTRLKKAADQALAVLLGDDDVPELKSRDDKVMDFMQTYLTDHPDTRDRSRYDSQGKPKRRVFSDRFGLTPILTGDERDRLWPAITDQGE